MNVSSKRTVGFCAAALLALLGCVGEPRHSLVATERATPAALGIVEARLEQEAEALRGEIRAGVVPGAVMVVGRNGKVAWEKTLGSQGPDDATPMSLDTIFRIQSMTKPVVSVAVMTLVQEGRIGLDDPVSKYLPEYAHSTVYDGGTIRPAKTVMTIRHLLTHTSGLIAVVGPPRTPLHEIWSSSGVWTLERTVLEASRATGALPLLADPGTKWNYGRSVDVLGAVLEVVTGKTFDAVLKERIFTPLGMKDTDFYLSSSQAAGRVAQPPRGGRLYDPTARHPMMYGTNGLASTTRDYLRFTMMLAGGGALDGVRILKPETLRLMTTNQLGPEIDRSNFHYKDAGGFGLGFGLKPEGVGGPHATEVWTWGGSDGTDFWVDPKSGVFTVFMIQNAAEGPRLQARFNAAVFESLEMPSGSTAPEPPVSALAHAGLLDQYCAKCHNTVDWAGGVAFDTLAVDPPAEDAASWEKAIRKMRTGLMPPPGEKRPSRAELDAFAGELETQLDAHARRHLAPGVTALHRLNRTEYANAIRDLIAYDADVSTLLPADDSAEGFDNIADVLGISPTLAQAYIAAAMKISRGALGDLAATPATTKYTPPGGLAQRAHLDGLPLGTQGGIRFTHYFPVDAEYEFRITPSRPFRFAGSNGGPPPKVDFVLDGARVEVQDPNKFRLRVKAGPRVVSVALIDPLHWDGVDELYSKARPPRDVLSSVSINGPFEPTGAGDTPSRRAVFTCHPVKEQDEAACARRIFARLASKAFRKPAGEHDPSIDTLMSFYETARASGGFEQGVQQGLARLLADPRFLYRAESEPAGLAPGSIYRVSDIDLASRLSFFIWSSIPDETLITLASSGKLSEPAVLEQQVRRMLADPRSRALVDNFGGQWLRLRELRNAQPLDGGFDDNLREAFEQETQLLFADMIREDLPITHLLDSSYTYLNERLARHYGIPDVHGTYMRQVALPKSSPRRGLLGQGSILTLTSAGNRTSPVMRGSWVLETVMAAPPPRPPPGVETDLKEEGDASHAKSVRERLELHRSNKTCASCHQIMDPIGFSLENFDLLGRWRDKDGATPVDPNGTLMDGTPLQGPADLRRFLVSQPDQFTTSAAEKLLTYALGRRLEAADQPAVREIVRHSKAQGYRFSSLVLGVVESVPFQMRMKE